MRSVKEFMLNFRSEGMATRVFVAFTLSFVLTVTAGVIIFPRAWQRPAPKSPAGAARTAPRRDAPAVPRPIIPHADLSLTHALVNDTFLDVRQTDLDPLSPRLQSGAGSGARVAAPGPRGSAPHDLSAGPPRGIARGVRETPAVASPPGGSVRRPATVALVTEIAVWGAPRWPWVSITASGPVRYRVRNVDQDGVVLDVFGARLALASGKMPVGRGPVRQIRASQFARDIVRVVLEFTAGGHGLQQEHGVRGVQPMPVRVTTSPDKTAIVVRLVE